MIHYLALFIIVYWILQLLDYLYPKITLDSFEKHFAPIEFDKQAIKAFYDFIEIGVCKMKIK